jgi:apolipoprotein N-acyltransferase
MARPGVGKIPKEENLSKRFVAFIKAAHEANLKTPVPAIFAAISSGVLLGLGAVPEFSSVLSPLVWIWLVPLLLVLGPRAKAWRLLMYTWIAGALATIIATYGLAGGLGWLIVIYAALAGLQYGVLQFLVFLMVRRVAGARIALWSLPLIWPLVEWLYVHVNGSPVFLVIAVTQANALWLIQFADILGQWGIAGWVMSFNVLVYWAVIRGGGLRMVARRLAVVTAALLIYPMTYSAIRLHATPDVPTLHALLLQPNPNPGDMPLKEVVEQETYLTDLEIAKAKPDLIVWPESAVPFPVRQTPQLQDFLSRAVADWGTPLLFGGEDTRGGRDIAFFHMPASLIANAGFVIVPGAPGAGPEETRMLRPHWKRHLVPFVEGVPVSSRSASMTRLYRALNGSERPLRPGNDYNLFEYADDSGHDIRFATAICWEEAWPSDIAEFTRRGAQFFATIARDADFGQTRVSFEHAAIARLRTIETRRPFLHVSTSGVTAAFDAQGRILALAPAWKTATLRAAIAPADELTFYVRHPDAVPICSGCLIVAIALWGFLSNVTHNRRVNR